VAQRNEAQIAAQIAALQAQPDAQDGGVYEDPATLGRIDEIVAPV